MRGGTTPMAEDGGGTHLDGTAAGGGAFSLLCCLSQSLHASIRVPDTGILPKYPCCSTNAIWTCGPCPSDDLLVEVERGALNHQ